MLLIVELDYHFIYARIGYFIRPITRQQNEMHLFFIVSTQLLILSIRMFSKISIIIVSYCIGWNKTVNQGWRSESDKRCLLIYRQNAAYFRNAEPEANIYLRINELSSNLKLNVCKQCKFSKFLNFICRRLLQALTLSHWITDMVTFVVRTNCIY